MTYDEIKSAWNAQADEHNQWEELGEDEKVEWAAAHAAAKAHATADDLLEALHKLEIAASFAAIDDVSERAAVDIALCYARDAIAKAVKDTIKT